MGAGGTIAAATTADREAVGGRPGGVYCVPVLVVFCSVEGSERGTGGVGVCICCAGERGLLLEACCRRELEEADAWRKAREEGRRRLEVWKEVFGDSVGDGEVITSAISSSDDLINFWEGKRPTVKKGHPCGFILSS